MTMNTSTAVAPAATEGVLRSPGRAPRGNRRRNLIDGALFLAPFMLVYAIFLLGPVFQAIYMSGFNWDLLSPIREFLGFQNYVRMFGGTGLTWSVTHDFWTRLVVLALAAGGLWLLRKGSKVVSGAVITLGVALWVLMGIHPGPGGSWNDEIFWTSLRNTLVFTIVSTPILIGLGLALALLVNTKGRGRAVYRAAFFLPYVLPISAVTLIWSYMLNPDRGLIAGFLGWFGLEGIPWLSDPALAMPAIIVTSVWWGVGFNMVLFLAGLQDIEPAYYEAASLDGASWWQQFRHVTVPGLSHVTILVAVTQFIASFQIFGQVYIMTRGGPGTATVVLIQHIYETGFKNYQLGYAAAISVFLFVVMAAVAAIQFRVMARTS
ncbi:carbohydrate ABC transporter permease [uncultured Microbacterium sp.]|uniref:carbohydrate ABC transporter permease n=1 Tax=uncultured Microbacterium sp. TaxID=191216 RepID=UPI0035CB0B69